LSRLGVDVVICGMITRQMEAALHSKGVRVIPHVCGQVDDVLRAFVDGRLNEGAYRMPGCLSRRPERSVRNQKNTG